MGSSSSRPSYAEQERRHEEGRQRTYEAEEHSQAQEAMQADLDRIAQEKEPEFPPEAVELIERAEAGETEAAMRLVAAGAPLDAQAKYGQTAMMRAVIFGHNETAAALIEAGAGLDLQDQCGTTALMEAADKGNIQMVSTLIKGGAELDLQETYGRTALMLAAFKGHNEVVEALIGAKADLNLRNQGGNTALMFAGLGAGKHTGVETVLIRAGASMD